MFCKVVRHLSGLVGQVITTFFQVANTSLNSGTLYQEEVWTEEGLQLIM